MTSKRRTLFEKTRKAEPVPVAQATWILPLLVTVIAALVFAPVLQNDFVNWDDRVNILDNRSYRGLSWAHLQWMFTTFHNSLYRPLTWITLGADYLLWGMNPAGYHLTSLILHCAAVLLFYCLSVQLLSLATASLSGRPDLPVHVAAAFAALLFAIHPLRVEPIAWASGRENVVAAPFFILTLIFYLRAIAACQHGASYFKWLIAAWMSYALSLLGKGAGVTLPLALLVLDVYPLRRLSGAKIGFAAAAARLLLEKAPFFLLALIAGSLAIHGKQQSKLMYGLAEYGIADRVVQTVYGLGFYLWKTVLPVHLSNLYEIESLSPFDWRFGLNALTLAVITAAFWIYRQRWPWALACWVYYCVILLPYIGVAQNGPQIAADRYSYLACLPWALVAGGAMLYGWRAWQAGRVKPVVLFLGQGVASLVLLALGVISWQQSGLWRDSETLWQHALTINEKSFFAHHFLAAALLTKGRAAEAMGHFQRSLELNPNYVSARIGLANALADQNDLEKSVDVYRSALTLDPDASEAHYGLARVLTKRGDADGAIQHYMRALAVEPGDPDTHNNLGLLLAARGENEQAMAHFQAALRNDRGYAKAHYNLGRMLVREGKLDEAIDHFRQALNLQGGVAEIHESLGRALALQGKIDEATKHLEEAMRILKTRQQAAGR